MARKCVDDVCNLESIVDRGEIKRTLRFGRIF